MMLNREKSLKNHVHKLQGGRKDWYKKRRLSREADFLVRSGLHSKRQIQDISRENCLVETRSEYVERKFGYAGKLIARGM